MKVPTSERLAQVLEAEGLGDLAVKARSFYYDDYKSPLATPSAELVLNLLDKGRMDLAKRAANGEWDGTREEADAWFKSQVGIGR